MQDWRSRRVRHEPSGSSGFCEHEESASCATRFLFLAFGFGSRANKSANKDLFSIDAGITKCIVAAWAKF